MGGEREWEGILGHFVKGPVVIICAICCIFQILSLWPLGETVLLALCG